MLFATLLLWLIFVLFFKRIEAAEPDYANVH